MKAQGTGQRYESETLQIAEQGRFECDGTFQKHIVLRLFGCISAQKAAFLTVRPI
jgi:hypothetical protein